MESSFDPEWVYVSMVHWIMKIIAQNQAQIKELYLTVDNLHTNPESTFS